MEDATWENTKTIRNTATAFTNGLTEDSILANGCEENNMDSVSTKQPKPISSMDYGKKEKESNGSMNNL